MDPTAQIPRPYKGWSVVASETDMWHDAKQGGKEYAAVTIVPPVVLSGTAATRLEAGNALIAIVPPVAEPVRAIVANFRQSAKTQISQYAAAEQSLVIDVVAFHNDDICAVVPIALDQIVGRGQVSNHQMALFLKTVSSQSLIPIHELVKWDSLSISARAEIRSAASMMTEDDIVPGGVPAPSVGMQEPVSLAPIAESHEERPRLPALRDLVAQDSLGPSKSPEPQPSMPLSPGSETTSSEEGDFVDGRYKADRPVGEGRETEKALSVLNGHKRKQPSRTSSDIPQKKRKTLLPESAKEFMIEFVVEKRNNETKLSIEDRMYMAQQTGLSVTQVETWLGHWRNRDSKMAITRRSTSRRRASAKQDKMEPEIEVKSAAFEPEPPVPETVTPVPKESEDMEGIEDVSESETDDMDLAGDDSDTDQDYGDGFRGSGPQRLPESAVRMMENWIVTNGHYPSKDDKARLASESGLTENQVVAWFERLRKKEKGTYRRSRSSQGTAKGGRSRYLPEEAKELMRCWFDSHPTEAQPPQSDIDWLASQTKLSALQVSTWFRHYRSRYLKNGQKTGNASQGRRRKATGTEHAEDVGEAKAKEQGSGDSSDEENAPPDFVVAPALPEAPPEQKRVDRHRSMLERELVFVMEEKEIVQRELEKKTVLKGQLLQKYAQLIEAKNKLVLEYAVFESFLRATEAGTS